jgi:hypothetical protein
MNPIAARVSIIIVFTVSFSYMISCASKKDEKVSETKKHYNDLVDKPSIKDNDTLKINTGKDIVIMFTLSQEEYDNLEDSLKEEMNEVLSDFHFNSDQSAKKYPSIKFVETGSPFITVGTNFFDKSKLDAEVGYIFITKEGKILILKNVFDEESLNKELESFFHQ